MLAVSSCAVFLVGLLLQLGQSLAFFVVFLTEGPTDRGISWSPTILTMLVCAYLCVYWWLLSRRLWRLEAQFADEYQWSDGRKLLLTNQKMFAKVIRETRYDVGSKTQYLQACVDYALRRDDLPGFKDYLKRLNLD